MASSRRRRRRARPVSSSDSLNDVGKALIALGALLVVVGVVLVLAGRVPWIGRLPGDIHIQRGSWTFYFPLATSLLLSVALTLFFYLVGRR